MWIVFIAEFRQNSVAVLHCKGCGIPALYYIETILGIRRCICCEIPALYYILYWNCCGIPALYLFRNSGSVLCYCCEIPALYYVETVAEFRFCICCEILALYYIETFVEFWRCITYIETFWEFWRCILLKLLQNSGAVSYWNCCGIPTLYYIETVAEFRRCISCICCPYFQKSVLLFCTLEVQFNIQSIFTLAFYCRSTQTRAIIFHKSKDF